MGEKPTIEQVAWVFERLREHLKKSGSYHVLIYGRMGFGSEAYIPLLEAGGIDISNALCLSGLLQRGSLLWFAEKMGERLQDFDPAKESEGCSVEKACEHLFDLLMQSMNDLHEVASWSDPEHTIEAAADVANVAMAIADVAYRITEREEEENA